MQILCSAARWRITSIWVASNISTIACAALSCCDARRLLQFLGSARSSIDVCVFTITCDEIAEALLAAQKRGVRVRIISDNDQVCIGTLHVVQQCTSNWLLLIEVMYMSACLLAPACMHIHKALPWLAHACSNVPLKRCSCIRLRASNSVKAPCMRLHLCTCAAAS